CRHTEIQSNKQTQTKPHQAPLTFRRASRRPPTPPSPSFCENRRMPRAIEEMNRRMLRSRDTIDRTYAQPLDIRALAGVASVSEAHYIRTFKATFAETPHRYLQRRRVERAMFLLRETERQITDICLDVGFTSLGTDRKSVV